jgi:hypothetical protein
LNDAFSSSSGNLWIAPGQRRSGAFRRRGRWRGGSRRTSLRRAPRGGTVRGDVVVPPADRRGRVDIGEKGLNGVLYRVGPAERPNHAILRKRILLAGRFVPDRLPTAGRTSATG